MLMTALPSMAAFALASSISPGPVNVVALSSGAQFGLPASMRHVTGATVGFSALLWLTGMGLHDVLKHWPHLTKVIQWAGVAFLLYMACKLALDDGTLGVGKTPKRPSLVYGATMQWLNPKAWLASLAGMAAFAAHGEAALVSQFTLIYFVICYLSIACWACAGALLRQHLRDARRVRFFNRVMAALLAASALYLLEA